VEAWITAILNMENNRQKPCQNELNKKFLLDSHDNIHQEIVAGMRFFVIFSLRQGENPFKRCIFSVFLAFWAT